MKDSICLIPPDYFLSDKSYSNVVEYAFKTKMIADYLRLCKAESRVSDGECSDYDVLVSLVDCFGKTSDTASRSYRYFSHVLSECFGIDAEEVINGEIAVNELWSSTADILMKGENTLLGILSRSKFDEIYVAMSPFDRLSLPDKIGNTKIKRVICPLGVRGDGILKSCVFEDFSMVRLAIDSAVRGAEACAILLDELDFEFAEPNLYITSLVYDKIKRGNGLKDSEKIIFKTQLLRDVMTACSEHGKTLLLALPDASNIKGMYQTEQLFDYIDGCIQSPIDIAIIARDVVGYSFATSLEAKKYKKITVEAAIGGTDRYFMTDDAKYFGIGHMPERTASLADTPVHLGSLIC